LAEVLYNIFKNSSSLGFDDTWNLASDPHVYPHIWGVNQTNKGKFLKIKDVFPSEGSGWSQSNNAIEWVDLPTGTTYTPGTGITISQQNEISINTTGASTNQVLTKTANGIGWTTPQ